VRNRVTRRSEPPRVSMPSSRCDASNTLSQAIAGLVAGAESILKARVSLALRMSFIPEQAHTVKTHRPFSGRRKLGSRESQPLPGAAQIHSESMI